jgi:hypothetical protein
MHVFCWEILSNFHYVQISKFSLPSLWRFDPIPCRGLPWRGFAITLIGHNELGRTPLDNWSAQSRDLYLTTHNAHKTKISMPPAGIKPTILRSECPQTHALDCEPIGVERFYHTRNKINTFIFILHQHKFPLLPADRLWFRSSHLCTFCFPGG